MAGRENPENEKGSCKAWCESVEKRLIFASTFLDFLKKGCSTSKVQMLLNHFHADTISEIKKVSVVGYSSKLRKSSFICRRNWGYRKNGQYFDKYLPEMSWDSRMYQLFKGVSARNEPVLKDEPTVKEHLPEISRYLGKNQLQKEFTGHNLIIKMSFET